jgi:replicative DNA helicase
MNTVHRPLPHSLEAESSLLSACFIDAQDVVSRCILEGITPRSFYDPKHADIFGVILDCFLAQRPVQLPVVAEELKAKKLLERIGGYPMLMQVSDALPSTASAGYFIKTVREKATLREVIAACAAAVEECHNCASDVDSALAVVGSSVANAIGRGEDRTEETFQKTASKLLDEAMKPRAETDVAKDEVSWGLLDLDRTCGRLCPGSLAVLAGMPSTGKSALADQLAWNHAAKGGETIIFTYEMTKRDKAVRIAQQVSRLNYDQLHKAPADMRNHFIDAVRGIAACKNLHVFEKDYTVNRLVSRVRAFSNKGVKVGLIVVDFLQYLARLEPSVGKERTDEKIGRMTAALKALAKDCACPVVLLSSLNREGYKEGNRPNLASLRSSGEIESDADVVAILHWPKENPITRTPQDPHEAGQSKFYVEFNQDKGRSKGVHAVGISFDRQSTRFENVQF